MRKFFILLIGVSAIFAIVWSNCPLKKKNFEKIVDQYEQCIDKGFRSKLGCKSRDMKVSKKVKKKCCKMEKKLKKCGYNCKEELTLRATCDNLMTVYVDGAKQKTDRMEDWKKESVIPMSTLFTVIAIKCINLRSSQGILASLQNANEDYVLVTDKKWRCSTTEEKGWMNPDFRETFGNWQPADIIGSHMRMWPWLRIGQISEEAKWIWTKARQRTVYCRYSVN